MTSNTEQREAYLDHAAELVDLLREGQQPDSRLYIKATEILRILNLAALSQPQQGDV